MSYRPRSAARWRRRVALIVAIALLGAIVWAWHPLRLWAKTDTSYAARIACSCHYIDGRDLADCRKDLLPGMGLVMLSEDDEGSGGNVTARLLPLASQTAFYRRGPGCVLERAER